MAWAKIMTSPLPRKAAESWQLASGSDLYGLTQGGESLTTLLPVTPAVYMWKLRLRSETLVAHDPERTLRHLVRLAKIPQGRTLPISASQGLALLGIEVCGPGLPDNKKKVFAKFLAQPKNSRWLINYLESLEQHLPALYVGETGNLAKRAFEHLSGLTDFGSTLSTEPGLTWADLNLYYMPIGGTSDSDSPLRKAVEYITAVVTISAFTRRAG